jgi:hypothetical protein
VGPCSPPPPLPRRPVTIVAELSLLHSEPTHVTNKLTLPCLTKSNSADRHLHYAYILCASCERKSRPLFQIWNVKRTSWCIITKWSVQSGYQFLDLGNFTSVLRRRSKEQLSTENCNLHVTLARTYECARIVQLLWVWQGAREGTRVRYLGTISKWMYRKCSSVGLGDFIRLFFFCEM